MLKSFYIAVHVLKFEQVLFSHLWSKSLCLCQQKGHLNIWIYSGYKMYTEGIFYCKNNTGRMILFFIGLTYHFTTTFNKSTFSFYCFYLSDCVFCFKTCHGIWFYKSLRYKISRDLPLPMDLEKRQENSEGETYLISRKIILSSFPNALHMSVGYFFKFAISTVSIPEKDVQLTSYI